jgi:hypothetical protein
MYILVGAAFLPSAKFNIQEIVFEAALAGCDMTT